MAKSILVPMIQGYLTYHLNFNERSPIVASEAARIAAKIRERLGRFDESSEYTCAWIIQAITNEPDEQTRLALLFWKQVS